MEHLTVDFVVSHIIWSTDFSQSRSKSDNWSSLLLIQQLLLIYIGLCFLVIDRVVYVRTQELQIAVTI